MGVSSPWCFLSVAFVHRFFPALTGLELGKAGLAGLLRGMGTVKNMFRACVVGISAPQILFFTPFVAQDSPWQVPLGCLFICDGVVRSSSLHTWYGAIALGRA